MMIKRFLPVFLYFLFSNSLAGQPMSLEEAEQCVQSAKKIYAQSGGNARLDSAQSRCLQKAVRLFLNSGEEYVAYAGTGIFLQANQFFLQQAPDQTDSLLQKGIHLVGQYDSPSTDSLLAMFYNYANILYSEYYYDFDRAMSANRLAIDYHRRIDEKRGLAAAYLNGTGAYARFGYCEQAADYLKKGKALLPEVSPLPRFELFNFSRYLSGVVDYCRASKEIQKGNLSAASAHLDSVRATFWNLAPLLRFTQQNDKLNRVLFTLGSTYLLSFPPDQSALDSAAFYLEQAFELGMDEAGESRPTIRFLKESQAAYQMPPDSALRFLNELSDSIGLYREGRRTKLERDPSSFPSKYRALEITALKASMLLYLYEKKEAYLPFLERGLKDLELLAELLNRLRYQYGTGKSQEIAGEWFSYFFALGSNMAERLYRLTGEEEYLERGLALSELNKSYVLRQSVFRKLSQHTFEGEKKAINDRIVELQAAVQQRQLDYRAASLSEKEEAGRALLDAKIRLWDYLEALKSGTPEEQAVYKQRYNNESPTLDEIQNWLPPNTAIIDYNVGYGITTAYILTRTEVKVDTLGAFRDWKKHVDDFEFGVREDPFDFPRRAYTLYDAIAKKVIDQLPDHVERLIIIPENQLWRVSFGALNTSAEGEKYLVEDYDIDYCSSLTLLLQGRDRDSRERSGQVGIFLAPDSVSDAAICFSELSSLEAMPVTARRIADSQENAVLIPGATRQQFLEEAGQYSALTLVLHGCADASIPNPLDYALIFNSDSGEAPDRLLSAWEIHQMDLTRTRWAFLGACNVAWGQLRLGEGLASLANAFAAAGCPALIVSRYPVFDSPTAQLMAYFFEEANSGATASAALNRAQRRMIEEDFLPSQWANMMLVGRGN